MSVKVVIGGPPRSGKTLVGMALDLYIRDLCMYRSDISVAPVLIDASIESDGFSRSLDIAWDAVIHNTADARSAITAHKNAQRRLNREIGLDIVRTEFVEEKFVEIRDCQAPIVLINVGGAIMPDNRQICSAATHIILVAGVGSARTSIHGVHIDSWDPWYQFARELGLVVLAGLVSNPSRHTEEVISEGRAGSTILGIIPDLGNPADVYSRTENGISIIPGGVLPHHSRLLQLIAIRIVELAPKSDPSDYTGWAESHEPDLI